MVGKFVRSDGRKIPTSFGGLLLYGLGRPRSGDSSRRVKVSNIFAQPEVNSRTYWLLHEPYTSSTNC